MLENLTCRSCGEILATPNLVSTDAIMCTKCGRPVPVGPPQLPDWLSDVQQSEEAAREAKPVEAEPVLAAGAQQVDKAASRPNAAPPVVAPVQRPPELKPVPSPPRIVAVPPEPPIPQKLPEWLVELQQGEEARRRAEMKEGKIEEVSRAAEAKPPQVEEAAHPRAVARTSPEPAPIPTPIAGASLTNETRARPEPSSQPPAVAAVPLTASKRPLAVRQTAQPKIEEASSASTAWLIVGGLLLFAAGIFTALLVTGYFTRQRPAPTANVDEAATTPMRTPPAAEPAPHTGIAKTPEPEPPTPTAKTPPAPDPLPELLLKPVATPELIAPPLPYPPAKADPLKPVPEKPVPEPPPKEPAKPTPPAKEPAKAKPDPPKPAPMPDPLADANQAILALHQSGDLFVPKAYKAVRQAFARQFEARNEAIIRQAYGEEYDAFTAWLNQRPDIKEDFYTALDEKHDKLPAALRLFKDIWKAHPSQIEKYASLAIAVAVVWDNEASVYDYRHHQTRTKSTLPPSAIGAMDNFKFFLDTEKVMQGRAQFLPWEFQVFLVDHRTPLEERNWALGNYLAKRLMIGRCYQEVPYDHDLLRGNDPHLIGKAYTLENIRLYGGVCAMQADFAARVAKSNGVPAVYVTGQANTLGLHAWVMWVELKQVTKTQTIFSLESHGRYFQDHYYTGDVRDPQTGLRLLDRDLERRLGVVGLDPPAKRQAELSMRAYPLVCAKAGLDAKGRTTYLSRCLKVSPHNEAAWLELAQMAKKGEIDVKQLATGTNFPDLLFKAFNNYPDFVWKVFDDVITLQPASAKSAKPAKLPDQSTRYEQLVALFERGGRPDLACEARLKLADHQVAEKKYKEAASGLAFTVKKFPGEGRYIPRLMTKLQEVCQNFKGGAELLGQFYLEVLPTIPRQRGDEVSAHCIAMYTQAIAFFKENKNEVVVKALQLELDIIRLKPRK